MRKGKRCDLAFEKEHFPAKVGSQRNFVSNRYSWIPNFIDLLYKMATWLVIKGKYLIKIVSRAL